MNGPLKQVEDSSTDELAKERNREAADRTLLAWIRTSLALIGFGFGVDRIVNALTVGTGHVSTGLTALVGLSFMAVGIYAIGSASFDYRRELQLLAHPGYIYVPRKSAALTVAAVLALVGALAFIGILVQTLLGSRVLI